MSAFVIRNTGTGILPFSCYSASKIMYRYLNDTATCKTVVEKRAAPKCWSKYTTHWGTATLAMF